GLADELPIGPDWNWAIRVECQPPLALLGMRLIELDEVADERRQVEHLLALVHCARLQARNQQQGIEGLDDLIGLLNCALQTSPVFARRARLPQRRLGSIA